MEMESRSKTQLKPLSPSPQLSTPSATSCEKVHPENAARIKNLPTELLVQILLLSLARSYETEANDSLFGMDSVLSRLRTVCTRWNDTILGEPTFWTHINVGAGPRTVELNLLRSGALSLTILYWNVEYKAGSGEERPGFLESMDLIGRHTHRWKSISFWALDHELDELTRYLESSPLPEMECLKIRRGSFSGDLLDWVCGDAASPRKVVFDGEALPWNSSEFSSLVNIDIEGAVGYLDLLVALVQASQSLETLSLSDITFNDDDVEGQHSVGWPDESRPSVSPKLKDIQIYGLESPAAISCVLRCIQAPNITTLRMAEGRTVELRQGSQIIQALTTYHGSQSILTSMLHNSSSLAILELSCSADTMRLDLEDSVTHKGCRLELSLTREDWEESTEMIGEAVRAANIAIYLRFERLPWRVVAAVLPRFPSAVELEFASPDIPCGDILLILSALAYPIEIGGGVKTWICPQLFTIRLPGGWPEAEAAAIAETATSLKQARKNFNDQNTREDNGSDTYNVWGKIRVLVGGSEF